MEVRPNTPEEFQTQLGVADDIDAALPPAAEDIQFADSEIPTGDIDGVNDTFTLDEAPNPPESLQLYRNGILQRPDVDFTLNDAEIEYAAGNIPQSGDNHYASYRY